MSTAFRNFIITFALACALFAVVGYIVVNGVLDGLFNKGEGASEDVTEYSYENLESYYEGEYNASEEEIPSAEEFGESFVVFFEDHLNELCGAKYICINEENGKMVFENIPLNSTIVVNGYSKTIKDAYKTNGVEFLVQKFKYVFGVEVSAYMVSNVKTLQSFFSEGGLAKKLGIEMSCSLPYGIVDSSTVSTENPDEITYVINPGDVVLTPKNAKYIFEYIPEDTYDSQSASKMFAQIGENVFKAVFSNNTMKDNSDYLKKFFTSCKQSTFGSEKYGVLFGIYDGSYQVSGLSTLSSMAGKDLNWSTLPKSLESALK